MSKPITSRVKRSPLFKYYPSALKQTELGEASKRGGTLEGDDKNVKEDVKGKRTDYVHKGPMGMKDEERIGICKGTIKGDKSKVHCDDVVVGTKETVTKGDDIDYDTTIMQTNEGRILEPWEQNRLRRNTKSANRDVRRSKIKLGRNERKLARMKKRGKDSGSRYERLTAKKEENIAELATNKAAAANDLLARKSGGKQGETYQKADTIKTKGQEEPEVQLAQAKREAIRKAKDKENTNAANEVAKETIKDNVAKANNITTGQSGLVGEPVTVNLSGGFGDPADLYQKSDYSGMAMTRKGYNMKAKSPATKKLQGAQNTLPQHLQDTIKATPESPAKIDPMTIMMLANTVKSRSSNKMRSGFKMKGYGKK